MARSLHHLALALTAFAVHRTPARMTAALRDRGIDGLDKDLVAMSESARAEVHSKAESLQASGVGVVFFTDADFPKMLMNGPRPLAPVVFFRGNESLMHHPGVGMCGSRNVSEQGLEAADRCGLAVSKRELTIVSGYAKGVDTATHLAALKSGGSTVIVLAEGIDYFRIKREFKGILTPEHTLVLSQFAPEQRWSAYNAMARNALIFGLGEALIVIEAGEKGGTLAAGEGAMKLGRPVLVVDFGDDTPPGNRILLSAGGRPVRNPVALHEVLDTIAAGRAPKLETSLF